MSDVHLSTERYDAWKEMEKEEGKSNCNLFCKTPTISWQKIEEDRLGGAQWENDKLDTSDT